MSVAENTAEQQLKQESNRWAATLREFKRIGVLLLTARKP